MAGVARFRVPAGNYNVRLANREGEVLAEVGYKVSGDNSSESCAGCSTPPRKVGQPFSGNDIFRLSTTQT